MTLSTVITTSSNNSLSLVLRVKSCYEVQNYPYFGGYSWRSINGDLSGVYLLILIVQIIGQTPGGPFLKIVRDMRINVHRHVD